MGRESHFFNGMGPRLGNGISPCFFTFLSGGEFRDGMGPRLGNGISLVSSLL